MTKVERTYRILYTMLARRYNTKLAEQYGDVDSYTNRCTFDLTRAVRLLNVTNEVWYAALYDGDIASGESMVRLPLLHLSLCAADDFRYRLLKIPEINLAELSLVAFRVPGGIGRYQTKKIGRVVTAAYADLVREIPVLGNLVNYVAEKIDVQYVAMRTGAEDNLRVFVDSSLKAFEYAYLDWHWSATKSCMTVGDGGLRAWDMLNDKECSTISNNLHCRFYDKINTDAKKDPSGAPSLIEAYMPPLIKAAMLLDADNTVLARCLLWRVGWDEVKSDWVWYADRMYYESTAHAELLRQRLYMGGYIAYNKIIGSGCSDTYAIEDVKGGGVPNEVPMKWCVDLSLADEDSLAYMDTFKYYSHDRKRLSVLGASYDFELTETSESLGIFDCSCCKRRCFDGYNDDAASESILGKIFVDGNRICSTCAENDTVLCEHCGERIFSDDAYLYESEDGTEYYCGECWQMRKDSPDNSCLDDEEEDLDEEDEDEYDEDNELSDDEFCCDGCGEVFDVWDMGYHGDGQYCRSCRHDIAAGNLAVDEDGRPILVEADPEDDLLQEILDAGADAVDVIAAPVETTEADIGDGIECVFNTDSHEVCCYCGSPFRGNETKITYAGHRYCEACNRNVCGSDEYYRRERADRLQRFRDLGYTVRVFRSKAEAEEQIARARWALCMLDAVVGELDAYVRCFHCGRQLVQGETAATVSNAVYCKPCYDQICANDPAIDLGVVGEVVEAALNLCGGSPPVGTVRSSSDESVTYNSVTEVSSRVR
jgi:hypothetical protein